MPASSAALQMTQRTLSEDKNIQALLSEEVERGSANSSLIFAQVSYIMGCRAQVNPLASPLLLSIKMLSQLSLVV